MEIDPKSLSNETWIGLVDFLNNSNVAVGETVLKCSISGLVTLPKASWSSSLIKLCTGWVRTVSK